MGMGYFEGLFSVAEIKSEYRRLAKANHPDVGGDTATMQVINAEYHAALKMADGKVSVDDGKEYTYRYDAGIEQAVMDALKSILAIRGKFEVLLIGRWIWVMGDTKPIKEELKSVGCFWHAKRVCWYWRPDELKTYRRSRGSLNHLAAQYGYSKFSGSETDGKVTV